MDPTRKPQKRTYVVLLFVDVHRNWFEASKDERVRITSTHVDELRPYLKEVSLTSLQGTGLSKHTMIEILESESLVAIESMIETFKEGAKAAYGSVSDVLIMEKGIERLR